MASLRLANAGLAHLVERHLAKVEVASSSLVTRSNTKILLTIRLEGFFICFPTNFTLKRNGFWGKGPCPRLT